MLKWCALERLERFAQCLKICAGLHLRHTAKCAGRGGGQAVLDRGVGVKVDQLWQTEQLPARIDRVEDKFLAELTSVERSKKVGDGILLSTL